MDGYVTKHCTFDITSQNRCLSIAEFYCKFGVISSHSNEVLHQQRLSITETKYQLNSSESEAIIILVKNAIKQDFSHLETDFNTISTTSFDEIVVRPGGGSTQFGTGTIGGSVNLNNNFSFEQQGQLTVNTSYGSFNTKEIGLKASTSTSKLNVNGGLAYFDSDNDYEYANSTQKNENGEFYNKSAFLNGAYKFNSKQQLKLYTSLFNGLRHFSILETTQSRTKYKDETLRLLLEYNGEFNKFFINTKTALINEDYTYFPDVTTNNDLSTGTAVSKIIKNEFGYKINKAFLLKAFVNYNNTLGKGSNYNNEKREVFTLGAYFKHVVSSDAIGVNKPHPSIFEESMLLAGTQPQHSLMIGDNLETDIKGAQGCGIDQVFFNPDKEAHNGSPTFEVSHLLQMKDFL